jgi:hypothetical protein
MTASSATGSEFPFSSMEQPMTVQVTVGSDHAPHPLLSQSDRHSSPWTVALKGKHAVQCRLLR